MISRLKSQVAKVLACCGLVVVFVIDIADEGTILQRCVPLWMQMLGPIWPAGEFAEIG